jgi:hypothetical protein
VTAIGDSVMVDYELALERDLPNAIVDAAVSRQWSAGIAEVESLRARHELGQVVVIGLGTNGPVTSGEFDQMMAALAGTTRQVFVTVHVDQSWQSEVNGLLREEAASHPSVRLADWDHLVSSHPSWLYSDGTHLPIDGTGARALAALVAAAATGR